MTILIFLIFGIVCTVTAQEEITPEPDKQAKEAVALVMKYTGLEPNFLIVEETTKTANAYVKGSQRYIGYNPDFIKRVKKTSQTDWAAVSVLAHEIGHHLAGHTIKPKGINPGDELAADKFSGFILFQMGASLEEAKSALKAIGNEIDTINHPPVNLRLQAVSNGWLQAEYLSFTKDSAIINEANANLEKFEFKCKFKGDPNVYFVNSNNDIIWFDNYGKAIVIGKKTNSESRNYSWIYNYRNYRYGVDKSGNIWDINSEKNIFIAGTATSNN
ncbi:MAG: M48 family metalloprotease [Bacteroidales bacterium]|nr:M48 family metalloprotease [Bacteroidales bacterium]